MLHSNFSYLIRVSEGKLRLTINQKESVSDNALGGNVGLVISQALILTGMVQHGIRQSAEVVSQMTSVERILQYTKLETEGPFETLKKPPTGWPNKGEIQFEDTSLRYAIESPPVLKNINFVIKPGHKVFT